MTFIVPFEDEFCGEIRTIYSVNEDDPKRRSGHCTTSEKCPHCGERNFFRVYDCKSFKEDDEYVTEVYDCKCPNCKKEFDLELEFEI